MTGQILHKPVGVELTKEKLQKCFKSNERHISVAYSFVKNGSKFWNTYQFEKLSSLEEDKCFNDLLSKDSDAVIYFSGIFNAKPSELPFYTTSNKRDWFWYALEGVCSVFSSSNEGDCFYNNFVKNISPDGAYSLWKKLAESGKIGRTVGIKQGIVSRFGTWIEEEGVFYSNGDHNKKSYEYSYPPNHNYHRNSYTPNPTVNKVDNISSLNYPEVHTLDKGLLAAKAGEGLLKFYSLYTNYPHLIYLDDVTSERYKKAGLIPMDFIKSIQTENSTMNAPTLDYLKSSLSTFQKVTLTVIRFVNCEKSKRVELDIELTREPSTESNEENSSLKPHQRGYILKKLNVALVMSENDCDEATAMELIKDGQDLTGELSSLDDSALINRADECGIRAWRAIHS